MTRIEREVIHWARLLFERRLISGWGGNLSCRSGKDHFLITGQHAPLGFLEQKHLVRIDNKGAPFEKNQKPSSETPLHLAVYADTDAEVVVHVHPPKVIGFSLVHERFVPLSFEEKYTIGDVPIIAQDTPTVTRPERIVEELKYHPVVIIKGHGTVAIGSNFQDAFLLTDLLEEAVGCRIFKESIIAPPAPDREMQENLTGATAPNRSYALFSRDHMQELVNRANEDPQFRGDGTETGLTTSLTLRVDETQEVWTVTFVNGAIAELNHGEGGEFMISGKTEWWLAVFNGRIDPFLATQQGKLQLQYGELARLSRWYKPFQRAFSLWQTVPVR